MANNPVWLLEKAASADPRRGYTDWPAAALGNALPRPAEQFLPPGFGPGVPLTPYQLDVPTTGGYVEPRQSEYTPGWNFITKPDAGKLVPFDVLRALAVLVMPVRRAIEIRRAQVSAQHWDVRVRQEYQKRADLDTLNPIRQQLIQFLQQPDRGRGWDWGRWIGALEEERAVTDAVCIYPRPTVGRDAGVLGTGIFALEQIDGSLIRPLRDYRGSRPQPPAPAYQQYLYGAPRVDLWPGDEQESADNPVVSRYHAAQIIYQPFSVRVNSPFGLSLVEGALNEIKLWMDRQRYLRAFYDEGDVPAVMLDAPLDWKPQQLIEYEQKLNRTLAGDMGWKHRIKVIPHGSQPYPMKPFAHDITQDEQILRWLALAMGVRAQLMEVQAKSGLGGKGMAEEETSRETRLDVGPDLSYIEYLVNQFLTNWVTPKVPLVAQLEFAFIDAEDEDPLKKMQVQTGYVNAGIMTRNAVMEENGWDANPEPMANELTVTTAQGVTRLADAVAMGAASLEHAQNPPPPVPHGPPAASDQPATAEPVAQKAALAELDAWERYEQRHAQKAARPFVATALPRRTVADLQALLASPVPGVPPERWRRVAFGLTRATLGKAGRGNEGNPEALKRWYEDGADGAIDWGEHGDFDACVAIASKHLDDAAGFCAERHHAATGEWPGKNAHKVAEGTSIRRPFQGKAAREDENAAVERLIQAHGDDLAALARQLTSGAITRHQFLVRATALLTTLATTTGGIGAAQAGNAAAYGASDAAALIDRKQAYLDSWADDLDGEVSEAATASRATLWAAAGWTAYQIGRVRGGPAGAPIIWTCRDDDASCEDCVSAAEGSPYDSDDGLPFWPGEGQCSGNCRCETHCEVQE